MRLTNDSYFITLSTKNGAEKYYREADGWVKVSCRGRKFRATAEQVLNHLLPVLAGLKPGMNAIVEHDDDPSGILNPDSLASS